MLKSINPEGAQRDLIALGITLLILIWSGINPEDRLTWALEIFPVILGIGFIFYFYKRFKLSGFTIALLMVHAAILCVGGKYTYAENPLFDWLSPLFGWERNHYDKVGHFAQGFVPVLVAREIMLRNRVFRKQQWLPFFLITFAGFVSAVYEIIEWVSAEMLGEGADQFLGTQGYVWDTQSDMLLALIGGSVAIIFFSQIQNRALEKLRNQEHLLSYEEFTRTF